MLLFTKSNDILEIVKEKSIITGIYIFRSPESHELSLPQSTFRIRMKHLSKLYIAYVAFIRPTLEYASIVWDGCFAHDIEKLEKVQISAARIFTDLPIFTSRESLYTG